MPLKCLTGPSYAFGALRFQVSFKGSFAVTALVDGKECPANLLVSSADMMPLISRDLINGLELSMHGSQMSPSVNAVSLTHSSTL